MGFPRLSDVARSDSHLFGRQGRQITDKRFVTDVELQQAVFRWLQTDRQTDTWHRFIYAWKQAMAVTVGLMLNPLKPELNHSAQRCLTRFLPGTLLLEQCISLIYE
jgi:hypothetical protein